MLSAIQHQTADQPPNERLQCLRQLDRMR